MSNVLSYSFFAIKSGFKDVCETLMQILYAHIFSPVESFHRFDEIDEIRVAFDKFIDLLWGYVIFELG